MTTSFFDITAADLKRFGDADARELVRRLCEAELRRHGAPAAALRAGGHDDAPDGGVDIRVTGLPAGWAGDFIPRRETVFQSKAEAMDKPRITREMRPRKTLRPLFETLGAQDGAYVIVSTRDNPTEPAQAVREAAMSACVAPLAHPPQVAFYGAARLATWVNQFPGVALWARARAGRPVAGWSPFGAWSATERTVDDPFLLDAQIRLRSGRVDPMDLTAGIDAMRRALVAQRAVRLVGLSGHGKTRLAQALFDDRVGADAPAPALAIYGDVGPGMQPAPYALAEQLVAEGREAVLVVDNCPGELHRKLIAVVQKPESRLRLLTIEYDVGEDDFQATTEFRLERASDGMVEALLASRGFDLSDEDRRQVARFSGGNARIALDVARSASGRGSLSALNDSELLDRLFGRTPRPKLRRLAEVLALVVSFDVQDLESDAAELPRLAALAGVNVETLYAAVADLLSLELVQRRANWRALLPQALAAKFARSGLRRLHPDLVFRRLVTEAPPRLVDSLCHRIGLLHDVAEAVGIAGRLLAPGGLVGDLLSADARVLKRFAYLAPADPDAALAALERAFDADIRAVAGHPLLDDITHVIAQLAYEPERFKRCVQLLARLPLGDDNQATHAGSRLDTLFHVILSGTAAPHGPRFAVVRGWLDDGRLELAEWALTAVLGAGAFVGPIGSGFGAHQRDHGWRPRSRDDSIAWYAGGLDLLVAYGALDPAGAAGVLAAAFGELWGRREVRTKLLEVTRALVTDKHDDRVWFAVRATLGASNGADAGLVALEEDLRPKASAELVRTYVFNPTFKFHNRSGAAGRAEMDAAQDKALALGEAAVADRDAFMATAVELVRTRQTQAFAYGQGYARASLDLDGDWGRLSTILATADGVDPALVQGFLKGVQARAPEKIGPWLDAAMQVDGIARHMTALQITAGLDRDGLARWAHLIDTGRIPLGYFQMGGAPLDGFEAHEIRPLISSLAAAAGGIAYAVDLLSMRLHDVPDADVPDDLRALGADVLASFDFDQETETMLDHHLGELVKRCLVGAQGAIIAGALAGRLRVAALEQGRRNVRYPSLVRALFEQQPTVTLDVLVVEEDWPEIEDLVVGLDPDPEDVSLAARQPIAGLDEAVARTWWAADLDTRGRRLALAIPYAEPDDRGVLVWRPLPCDLLDSEDGAAVLEVFFNRFFPTAGWGSPADRYILRRPLLEALLDHPRADVARTARELLPILDDRVKRYSNMWLTNEDQAFET